jgi:hypothetical protein
VYHGIDQDIAGNFRVAKQWPTLDAIFYICKRETQAMQKREKS